MGSHEGTGMLETLHSSAAAGRCVWFHMAGVSVCHAGNNSSLLSSERKTNVTRLGICAFVFKKQMLISDHLNINYWYSMPSSSKAVAWSGHSIGGGAPSKPMKAAQWRLKTKKLDCGRYEDNQIFRECTVLRPANRDTRKNTFWVQVSVFYWVKMSWIAQLKQHTVDHISFKLDVNFIKLINAVLVRLSTNTTDLMVGSRCGSSSTCSPSLLMSNSLSLHSRFAARPSDSLGQSRCKTPPYCIPCHQTDLWQTWRLCPVRVWFLLILTSEGQIQLSCTLPPMVPGPDRFLSIAPQLSWAMILLANSS